MQSRSHSEFELIGRYFAGRTPHRRDVRLGIGDDAAIIVPPADVDLAVTVDTLVEGVHFDSEADSAAVGHKALAVNMSDLAAMGAEPAWATLAITLPESDEAWLAGFCTGFFTLAQQFGVQLIGGDTTKGPRAITVQLIGTLPSGEGLRRAGGSQGDRVYVSGTLGDAALALLTRRRVAAVNEMDAAALSTRLDRPTPRVALGLALRGVASAAIDVSDGLAADLEHLVVASGVGVHVHLDRLPLSTAVREYIQETGDWQLPLAGGDDYELCFTVPENRLPALEQAMDVAGCECTWIGKIVGFEGVHFTDGEGHQYVPARTGFDHFAP